MTIASARVGWTPIVIAATVPCFVLAAAASAGTELGTAPAFLPVTIAVAWTCDALTALLLITQFLAGGSGRLLAL
ncbi:MAG: hypothetical protein JWO88_2082, partial [Frankiales bacterium]|nr:hypothetical protein [Frankiales bacterium]